MVHVLLLLLGALVVGAVAYGVTWVITGRDRGLDPAEPDGRAVPLPTSRPLTESDIETVRFDTVLRGYRMDQVDTALRRAAYDLGYKDELIEVLESELAALRAGRFDEADQFRAARETSQADAIPPEDGVDGDGIDGDGIDEAEDAEDAEQREPAESPTSSNR